MPDVVAITALDLERIHEIDVTEEGDALIRQIGTRLERIDRSHARGPRSAEAWAPGVREWQGFIRDGGAAFGVFDQGRMIAFCVLRNRLDEGTSQLAGLYVDRAWRRHGLGARLVRAAADAALADGARDLYVSAAPSEAAVTFYRSVGFEPLEKPNPVLFALEPEDVHMIMTLESAPGSAGGSE
ncbi:MAG: GNAT family N-acetyltransferase [Acidimicrobiales bacterium]